MLIHHLIYCLGHPGAALSLYRGLYETNPAILGLYSAQDSLEPPTAWPKPAHKPVYVAHKPVCIYTPIYPLEHARIEHMLANTHPPMPNHLR